MLFRARTDTIRWRVFAANADVEDRLIQILSAFLPLDCAAKTGVDKSEVIVAHGGDPMRARFWAPRRPFPYPTSPALCCRHGRGYWLLRVPTSSRARNTQIGPLDG